MADVMSGKKDALKLCAEGPFIENVRDANTYMA